ncbi:MAG: 6-phosphogluconolactonase [Myxococcales bacterium]
MEATAGAVAARGRALVALTGGSSAPALYVALRSAPWRDKVAWARLELFTGDERAVPPGDPLSNWGLAQRELFAHVPVAQERLHRMRGEAGDLEAEARRLAEDLSATAGEPPRLDLVLLGLGADGHILSCFAGVASSAERGDRELVRHALAPAAVEPRVARLTLTPFLVVTARTVVLQASGAAKAAVLGRALKGPEDLIGCPAQWLRRASGRVVIVADAAAASEL